MAASRSTTSLSYEGSAFFRQRLILSTLSGKAVRIRNIRTKDDEPGIREFEASFIRLLDKLTNGSHIEVNETGTMLYYQPGFLSGGQVEHACSLQRSIGYYLEAVICLAPFCKQALNLILNGITNDQTDPSVDYIKNTSLPVLKRFLGTDEFEFKVISRGMPPEGGGKILFQCPVRQQLRPVQFSDPGKIKRIRGIAYSARVAPHMANRMVSSAKGILLQFIPDVYIITDLHRGVNNGKSPGFGIVLVAETTTGVFLAAEAMSNPSGSDKEASVPEDVGTEAANLLLEEIYRGGCCDSTCQSTACLFMALGQNDVSKMKIGPLSTYTIHFLRHLKDFFQVTFKLETVKEEELNIGLEKVLLTCVGIGYSNLSKAIS